MKRFLLLFVSLLCLTFGCGIQESANRGGLPIEAVVEKDLGNGWVIFKIKEGQFLYHKESRAYQGFEALANLSCE